MKNNSKVHFKKCKTVKMIKNIQWYEINFERNLRRYSIQEKLVKYFVEIEK